MWYRQQLDQMGCANPACEHRDHRSLYFHSRCHPQSATWCFYDRELQALMVLCGECEKPIASVAVADQPDPLKRMPVSAN
jgi:hypothetical protein